MLHSRNSDSIRRILQAQQRLVESDEGERKAERRGLTGDPSGHLRGAVMGLRRARDSNDAHDIGVKLYRASPEAHQKLVDQMHPDNPHRVVVAAAPHLQRYTDLDARARLNPWGAKGQKTRAARGEAFERFRRAAANHGAQNPGPLMHAHHDEDMADHLDRIYHRVHGIRYRGFAGHDAERYHEGEFDDKQEAHTAAATAKTLYGKTHDVSVRERGVGRWHVTTRENKATAERRNKAFQDARRKKGPS